MKTLAEIEEHPLAFVRWAREAIFASCDYDHAKFAAHTREYEEQLKLKGWVFSDRQIIRHKTESLYDASPSEALWSAKSRRPNTEN